MFRQTRLFLILTILTLSPASSATFAQSESAIFHSIDGSEIRLADQKGKVVVLSFGGTWVPMEFKELPALQKVADRYSSRGVQFYWVSINSAKAGSHNYASDTDLRAFAQKYNLKIPLLRDPDRLVYKSFGLDVVPTVVIIDQQGNIAFKHDGFGVEQNEGYGDLNRVIERLLK